MAFPQTRLRRLRRTGVLRDLVRETELSARHLVYPMFVVAGLDGREPIASMPGIDRLSISQAVEEAGSAKALGIPAVLLFGVPSIVLAIVAVVWLREPVRGIQERRLLGADESLPEERPPGWSEGWRLAKGVRTLRRIWAALPFMVGSVVEKT